MALSGQGQAGPWPCHCVQAHTQGLTLFTFSVSPDPQGGTHSSPHFLPHSFHPSKAKSFIVLCPYSSSVFVLLDIHSNISAQAKLCSGTPCWRPSLGNSLLHNTHNNSHSGMGIILIGNAWGWTVKADPLGSIQAISFLANLSPEVSKLPLCAWFFFLICRWEQ